MTYKGEAFVFDPESMTYPEAIAFQAETRMKVGQWLEGLGIGDIACMMAAVWLCKWRGGERTLKFQTLTNDPDLRPLRDIGIEDDEAPPVVEESSVDPMVGSQDNSPSDADG